MPGFDRDDVLAAMTGRYADFFSQSTPLKPDGGELRGACPIHSGSAPNFAVNPDTGLWYCHSQCQCGGDVFDFLMRTEGLSFPDALERVAAFAGLSPGVPPLPRLAPRPAPKPAPAAVEGPFLDVGIAEGLHRNLMGSPKVQNWLLEHRGLMRQTLEFFQVGLLPAPAKGEEWRICFPVFDRQQRLTNIRKHLFAYRSDLSDERRAELNKTLPWNKGLRSDLYPIAVLDGAREAVIFEGEADALLACQMGFTAVTGTQGAGNWKPEWTEALRGLERVILLYDGDEAGRKGTAKVTAALLGAVAEVRVAQYPQGVKDLTEWVMKHGATTEDVQAAIDAAEVIAAPPATTQVGDEGQRLTGAKKADIAETFSLPTDVWPKPASAMFHGLAGDIVRCIEPHTEADPVALLVQILVAFGSAIGRAAYFRAEADRHYGNLYAVLVGVSSKGRKGTSWGYVRQLFEAADPDWASQRIAHGLSSGEGLIWSVRDPIEKQVKNKKTGEYETEIEDHGIADKRLLVQEGEFAGVLKVMGREGSTLSPIMRNGWDTGGLQALTKNSPARSTGAHISVVGHVTADELRRELSSTEAGNGFGNRFLWFCVRRSKELPEGGNLGEGALSPFILRLRAALEAAKQDGEMKRDEEARAVWLAVYSALSGSQPGLFGAVTGRGEAQVMRLAMLYALLDGDAAIRRDHMIAALALWEYVEASARFVFGDSMGDPVADDILLALRRAPDGMTRNDVRELFRRNQTSERIGQALALLAQHGRVRVEKQETEGRPAERWFAVDQEKTSGEKATR